MGNNTFRFINEVARTSMGSDHKAVRWLSQAKALQRIFELKEEIRIFLQNNTHPECKVFSNKHFITKLAYLKDIFEKNQLFKFIITRKPHEYIYSKR